MSPVTSIVGASLKIDKLKRLKYLRYHWRFRPVVFYLGHSLSHEHLLPGEVLYRLFQSVETVIEIK